MWKPREVIPEHRRRAWIVWLGLLLAITAYAIWEIVVLNNKYKNPSTSTTVKNEYFQFPFVTVCMGLGAGCSRWPNCAGTAFDLSRVHFDFGDGLIHSGTDDDSFFYYSSSSTFVVDDPSYSYSSSSTSAVEESKIPGCIGLDLSQHTSQGFETAIIDLVWKVAGGDSTWSDDYSTWSDDTYLSDSPLNDDGFSLSWYFEHVLVFLDEKEPDELDTTTYLTMPYQPITDATIETTDSYLTIGKTVKTALSGDKETSFPVLALSQSKYKTGDFYLPLEDGVDYGQMYLSIRQGPFSYTTITELDPLEVGTFLGNLGGFWELLIVVWGVCFVIQRQERGPSLKGRSFRIPGKRKGKSRALTTPAPDGGEERPDWDAGVDTRDIQHTSAHFPRPAGASEHGARQDQDSSSGTGDALPVPSKGERRRDSADGTNSSSSAGAAATGFFGRGLFRPSFRQHFNKSKDSLADNEYAATTVASTRRTVELENPIRMGSGANQSIRDEL